MQVSLTDVLQGHTFTEYLEYIPSGVQLTAFMATVWGIKPAMDVWVSAPKTAHFLAYCHRLGLCTHVQGYIDRQAFQQLVVPKDRFTTTHAVWSTANSTSAEAHIFLSLSDTHLKHTVACGWYPVIVDSCLIEKHYADHRLFGAALGYPTCCQQFFRQRNNWHNDNTYYASWEKSHFVGNWRMNNFWRHTPFTLISHMSCSALCVATAHMAERVWQQLWQELPDYAAVCRRQLQRPVLCLNELRLYAFDGVVQQGDCLHYTHVDPLSPTSEADQILHELRRGNRCVVDGNIVRVYMNETQIFAYMASNDQHGPECPCIVLFHDM